MRLALILALVPSLAWGQTIPNGLTVENGVVHCGTYFPCPPPDPFKSQRDIAFVCPDGYSRAMVEPQSTTDGTKSGVLYVVKTPVPKCARTDAVVDGEWK